MHTKKFIQKKKKTILKSCLIFRWTVHVSKIWPNLKPIDHSTSVGQFASWKNWKFNTIYLLVELPTLPRTHGGNYTSRRIHCKFKTLKIPYGTAFRSQLLMADVQFIFPGNLNVSKLRKHWRNVLALNVFFGVIL